MILHGFFIHYYHETHSEPFEKEYQSSILDFWLGFKYVSDYPEILFYYY